MTQNLIHLHHVLDVLKPTLNTLADALDVTRSELLAWREGKDIPDDKASRLAVLAKAADIMASEGPDISIRLHPSSIITRPLTEGKNFFELVKEGRNAEEAIHTLIRILRTEEKERAMLSSLPFFQGRPVIINDEDDAPPFFWNDLYDSDM
jgi:hypothetical protein